jgi:hypothetical protein
MLERYVKTFEEHLPIILTYQRDCDDSLNIFLLTYIASTHEITNTMAVSIVFWLERRLPGSTPTTWWTS